MRQRVHYVFGEGVNPRLRHLRDGLDELGLPSNALLSHGAPRLVYALSLIENLSAYLLGVEKRPKWIVREGEAGAARRFRPGFAGFGGSGG